jgi:hypothetical protein
VKIRLASVMLLLIALIVPCSNSDAQSQAGVESVANSTNTAPQDSKSEAAVHSTDLNPPGVERDSYTRPSQQKRFNDFIFNSVGPYPVVGAAFVGGINQLNDSPPEWHEGTEAYFKRAGSDLGIVAAAGTARYGLAEVFKEDTLYYRCDCVGIFPRTRHALFSTFTARRGEDGHRVFSVADLIAPYAGTFTAVYGWYPGRFGAKDAFRMGNYSLLAYAGGNLSLEFFYSGPHSLMARMHLNNRHAAPDPGPNHAPDQGSGASTTPNAGPKP